MKRASPLPAAALVFVLAGAALAQDYVPEAGGSFRPDPGLASSKNPFGSVPVLGHGVDERTVTVSLPFEFPFFGTRYTHVAVSDDGWIAFGDAASTGEENPNLPSTATPNGVVAPLWDGLRTGKTGSIRTFTDFEAATPSQAAAANHPFVIEWRHVTASESPNDDLSFEVVLHPDGTVELVYAESGRWRGLTYTAGIENESGTRAYSLGPLNNSNVDKPANQILRPFVVTFTGTVTRDKPVVSETGLTAATVNVPVGGADVLLVRDDTGDTIDTAATAADGSYTLVSTGLRSTPLMSVRLRTSGTAASVIDSSNKEWEQTIETGLVPDAAAPAPLSANIAANGDAPQAELNFRKALNVQQAAQRGLEWAQRAIDASTLADKALRKDFPQLDITWVPVSGAASSYTPASSSASARAVISDIAANEDAYDDDVVLREYAQHLLASMAIPAGTLVLHQWAFPTVPPTNAETEPFAMLDGFSFWFAAAVQGRSKFIDTKSASASDVFDLEPPSSTTTATVPTGPTMAGAVAASLWDLVDGPVVAPPAADDDDFAGVLPDTAYRVFTTLDDRQRDTSSPTPRLRIPSGSSAPTVASFFDEFMNGQTGAAAAAASREFIAHKTIADDPAEPNDRANEEKPFADLPSRTLNRANEDRFSFTLEAAKPQTVAVSWSESTQIELSILGATTFDGDGKPVDGPTLATAAAHTSPVSVTTPDTLEAGTYVIRVRWLSGPAAHYKLTKFTAPTLDVPFPAAWAAGAAFSHTFSIAGGVPPATVSLKETVPGLTIQGGGTRIGGTPTVPGNYTLHFSVTDASGAGPQPLPPIAFRVADALTLPEVIGVTAGQPFDADIGRGGVSATWTTTSDPAAQHFALAGGSTLRLTNLPGQLPAPGSFTIKASATDPGISTITDEESLIVVAKPVSEAADFVVAPSSTFGFWFDAIGGGTVNLDFRFAGGRVAPTFVALVDGSGNPVPLPSGTLVSRGPRVRIRRLTPPVTSRYFVVFRAPASFNGTVKSAARRIVPPRRFSGIVDVATKTTTKDVTFTVIEGSRLRVVLESAPAPLSATPGVISLKNPDGTQHAGPFTDSDPAARRAVFSNLVLAEKGTYVLTVRGDGATTGPLLYRIEITPPRGVVFSID